MDALGDMTLSKFKMWSVQALKVFLSLRKRSVTGDIDELAARAFCVWEENLPVDESAELAEKRLLQEYKEKLVLGGDIVPDPFSLTSGWKGEKTGLQTWPPTYMVDISTFLQTTTPQEMTKQLLNEYKLGKAYRYFESGWVREVFIHDIGDTSDKCVLKTKVTPSQSINSKCYDVWAVVEKDCADRPGGKILSAYCSCTAGMLGSCNHVAGLLFRVEHAVKTGETSASRTDQPSTWNVPKGKPIMKVMKAADVDWTKGRYGRNANSGADRKRKQLVKQEFTPLAKFQLNEVKDKEKMRKDLYELFKEDTPHSCFMLNMEKRRYQSIQPSLQPSVHEIVKELKEENNCTLDTLLKKLKMTPEQQEALKMATTDQSSSSSWFEHRRGRITSSIFQRVASRVATLRKKENVNPACLVQTVLGNSKVISTKAMKHGLSLEPVAKKTYEATMKKTHKGFHANDSGLTVYLEKPYLAASADLEVECKCCGKGLCEVKCPESVKEAVPSVDNISYLCLNINGQPTLQQTHPYYFQIQGQMAILNRSYCDFFVYTHHGHVISRIMFDRDFWETTLDSLSWFWTTYVYPVLTSEVDHNEDSENVPEKKEEEPTQTTARLNVRRALLPIQLPTRKVSKQKKTCRQQKKKTNNEQIFLCGVCGGVCLDEPENDPDQSVWCDSCRVWVHFACAGVTGEQLELTEKWFCSKCSDC